MCLDCRKKQQRIMAALLASEITLPPEGTALRERAEKLLPELEPAAARQVRACLALVFAANPPIEELADAIVRDMDVPMVQKAMSLFPARVMSQAGRMARHLADEFTAVADCIEYVIFGGPGEVRVEKADGEVRIHLNEPPEPTVADAPKPIVPHNGGRGPKPPMS